MELEFDLSDMKPSAIQRMLRQALRKEAMRSKPLHARGNDGKDGKDVLEDATTDEADDENDKLVSLHNQKGEPRPVPMDDEDMSDDTIESLRDKKKMDEPKVEKDRRPSVKVAKYKPKSNPKAK